ncbi:MAG: lamin tail domain-containing protein [Burkholderiales bacterium]|nr:lamin tail domain-containing protein [Bacteroidia bacterium]
MFLVLLLNGLKGQSQIYINEIMINPSGPNDGANMPNTAEWVELYNSSASAVNIGCWFLTDGDFAVTFPSGTTIAASGYYTIASAAGSGLSPNLNWATCGCTSGPAGEIGILTNSGEQVILYNSSSGIEDAIIWGGGQLPNGMITSVLGSCTPKNVTFPASGATYEIIGSNTDGVSKERDFDGSSTWQNGGSGTFGASNGGVILPIALLDFYATKNEHKNDIIWKVASQENIIYYTIDKSNDGVNFTEMVTVLSGNVMEVTTYSVIDENPFEGISYYRLGTQESNGTLNYQKIVSIDRESKEWNIKHYQFEQNLVMEFKNSVPAGCDIYLFDLSGKLLAQETVNQPQTKINTSFFAAGIYFIKIDSPYKTENFKVVITEN